MVGRESSTEDLERYFLSGEGLRGVQAQPHQHADAEGASMSVREFEYRGHQASIETTYRITIDGRPLLGHLEVLPDGSVLHGELDRGPNVVRHGTSRTSGRARIGNLMRHGPYASDEGRDRPA
jgi:hypothetical protein